MGKLLLLGYFGAGNLGDDGFVVDFLKRWSPQLRASGQTCDYTAAGPRDPVEGFVEADEVRGLLGSAVSRKALLTLRPGQYDALVAPGGSLLQNATSMRSLLFYLHVISRFTSAGVPVYMLGQGLGPFKGKLAGGLVAKTLKHVTLLTLRDKVSWEWATNIGLTTALLSADCLLAGRLGATLKPRPEYYDDLPYCVFIPKPSRTEPMLEQEFWQYVKPGDAPREFTKVGTTQRPAKEMFVEQLEGITDDNELEVVALHLGQDSALVSQLAERVGGSYLDRDDRTGNEVLSLIAGASTVVSYRLHGLVLASAYGVPSAGIAYDPKVTAFCTELGLPHCSPSEAGKKIAYDMAADLWHNREQVKATMLERRAVALQRLEAAEARFAQLLWGGA